MMVIQLSEKYDNEDCNNDDNDDIMTVKKILEAT